MLLPDDLVAPVDALAGNVALCPPALAQHADISRSGLDSITWCSRLLAETGVALTPGTDFDAVRGTDWVRLSFAAAPAVVAEAVDRIVAWQRTVGETDGQVSEPC